VLPDINMFESFQAKFHYDFRAAVKPTSRSFQSSIKWFYLLQFFLFIYFHWLQIGFGHLSYSHFETRAFDFIFANLMDLGWSLKTTLIEDIIRCAISMLNIVFRYHIRHKNLYVNFYFTRNQVIAQKWVPLEHKRGVPPYKPFL